MFWCCRYIWLLVLPFGIFPEASFWALLPVAVMTAMMLGLEDLACQLEDPFKFIPYGEHLASGSGRLGQLVFCL